MPNHYHFLVRAKEKDGISQFMKQLSNAYTHYFNEKYKRSGVLFEGSFKAVHVLTNELVLHISRYIHLNPVVAGLSTDPEYKWSSYSEYINESPTKICQTKFILDFFPSVYAYKKFVHDQKDYAKKLHELKGVAFD